MPNAVLRSDAGIDMRENHRWLRPTGEGGWKAMQVSPEIVKDVVVINENMTVQDAAILMTEKYIGALVVRGGKSEVRGLFTERDLMMKVVGGKKDPAMTLVKDVMPAEIIRIAPDESCSHCLELMKEYRCRHLLVFEGEHFVGIVSLRDVVAALISEKEMLISSLHQYITG